ncbi:hypothetical protein QUF90_07485, partial [Desulfococcaceae bacterium HSG9]|nr:hypothetical protein [Desulfococcaceae bacterium HSG9]
LYLVCLKPAHQFCFFDENLHLIDFYKQLLIIFLPEVYLRELLFSLPDFQSVRSMDKSCFSSRIGKKRTISQAISSMEKLKPEKKSL